MRAVLGLLVLAVAAVLGWGAYWFIGARTLDRTVGEVLATQPMIAAESHTIRGFPNRFDLTLNQPRLQGAGWHWQAPFVQLFALSYRPHHLIAVFANDQQIDLGALRLTLQSRDLRASLVMTPGLSLPLERSALVGEDVALQTPEATHRAQAIRFASQARTADHHDMVLAIDHAIPDPAFMDAMDPEGHWPRRFSRLQLNAEARFDRPLDRHGMEGTGPQLMALTLNGAHLAWPEGALTAQGAVTFDPWGRPSGEIRVTVENWRDLWARMRAAQGLAPTQADFIEQMLSGLADAETPDTLEAAFMLRDGVLMLGPVVLAELPVAF